MSERDRHLSKPAPASLARREFLNRAAMAAVFTGSAGLGVWGTRPAVAATVATQMNAWAGLPLELDGVFVGYVQAASGGEHFVDVASAATTPGKSAGAAHVAPLELTVSTGMSASFYGWISGFLVGKGEPRTVGLYQLDQIGTPVRRLALNGAVIVGVSMPPFDGSTATDPNTGAPIEVPMTMTVAIGAKSSSAVIVPAPTRPAMPRGPRWSANSFSLTIDGFDPAATTTHAMRIEGVGAKLSPNGGFVDVSNLKFTLGDHFAEPFYRWSDDAKGDERRGVIQMNPAAPIGTIELLGVGIVGVTPKLDWHVGPTAIVEVYCEQLRFNLSGFAA